MAGCGRRWRLGVVGLGCRSACGPARSPADSLTPPTTFDSLAQPIPAGPAAHGLGCPDIAATGSGWLGAVAAGGWAWLVWAAGSSAWSGALVCRLRALPTTSTRPPRPNHDASCPASLGCSGDAAVESGGWRRSPLTPPGWPPGECARGSAASCSTGRPRVAHPRALGPVSSKRPMAGAPNQRFSAVVNVSRSPVVSAAQATSPRVGRPEGRSGRGGSQQQLSWSVPGRSRCFRLFA